MEHVHGGHAPRAADVHSPSEVGGLHVAWHAAVPAGDTKLKHSRVCLPNYIVLKCIIIVRLL